MGYTFLPADQDKRYSRSPSLHDWVHDDDRLERFGPDRLGHLNADDRHDRRVLSAAVFTIKCARDRLADEVRRILDEADAIDEAEDECYGPESRGDELPEDLREPDERRKRIKEILDRLDERDNDLQDE